jgi:hypothetical protein
MPQTVSIWLNAFRKPFRIYIRSICVELGEAEISLGAQSSHWIAVKWIILPCLVCLIGAAIPGELAFKATASAEMFICTSSVPLLLSEIWKSG